MRLHMTFRSLIIFKTICEEGSFTKAGEVLYMTQPAVSQAISELEQELNIILFDRLGKKIYLTESGKVFLGKALYLLDIYENMKNDLKPQRIRIGSSITIANDWLPEILSRCNNIKNKIEVFVEVDTAKKTAEKLKRNEIDIALIEGNIQQDSWICIPLSSYQLRIVCANENKSAKKRMRIEELLQEPWLLREKGSAIREVFDSALTLRGLTVNPRWVSVNSQALIQAVKKDLGISILPEVIIKEELKKGNLSLIEMEDFELKNENHLVYHKEKYLTEELKEFLKIALKG